MILFVFGELLFNKEGCFTWKRGGGRKKEGATTKTTSVGVVLRCFLREWVHNRHYHPSTTIIFVTFLNLLCFSLIHCERSFVFLLLGSLVFCCVSFWKSNCFGTYWFKWWWLLLHKSDPWENFNLSVFHTLRKKENSLS